MSVRRWHTRVLRHLMQVALLLGSLTLGAVTGVAAAQEVGTIAELVGSGQISRGGTWTAAAVGAAIRQGDQLRTGRPGRMRIVFQDDSVVTLSDESDLTVDRQVFDPERGRARSLMGLLKGKVSALVSEYYHQPGTAFDVKTSTAVAGVRGTDFVVTHNPRADVTEVVGVSGHVEVRSALDPDGPAVLISAKEFTTVGSGRFPTAPKRLSESSFRQYLEGIEFIGAGRLESQTINHPLLAGAAVPQPDRAASLPGAGLGERGADLVREPRDASSIINQPPGVLQTEAGRLRIGLF